MADGAREPGRDAGREVDEPPVRVVAQVSSVVRFADDSARRREVERLLRKDWADCSVFASCAGESVMLCCAMDSQYAAHLEDLRPIAPATSSVDVELVW